jgi:hypothetical protein
VRTKQIDLNCVICGVLSKNYDDWENHVGSEKHCETAKRYKPIAQPQQPVQPLSAQQNQEMANTTTSKSQIPPLLPPQELLKLTAKFEEQLNQNALRQIVSKERKEWNCTHCNVTCQSVCSWDAHLVSCFEKVAITPSIILSFQDLKKTPKEQTQISYLSRNIERVCQTKVSK